MNSSEAIKVSSVAVAARAEASRDGADSGRHGDHHLVGVEVENLIHSLRSADGTAAGRCGGFEPASRR